jgi:hypothetical protein
MNFSSVPTLRPSDIVRSTHPKIRGKIDSILSRFYDIGEAVW